VANNVQALCASFKGELLKGIHNFGTGVTRATTAADTLKAALYLVNNNLGASTTAYSATGEVSGTGYNAGGIVISNSTPPAVSGTTAYWTPSANPSWSGLTIASAFDSVLFYNSTQAGRGIGVLTFTAQTISAGTFAITMPTNAPASALLQVN
jgi:hypothetical protein